VAPFLLTWRLLRLWLKAIRRKCEGRTRRPQRREPKSGIFKNNPSSATTGAGLPLLRGICSQLGLQHRLGTWDLEGIPSPTRQQEDNDLYTTVLGSFLSMWQNTWDKQEEIFILAHSLKGDSTTFGPVARQKYHGGRTWWRRAFHFMVAGKQRETWRIQTQDTRLKDSIPVTYSSNEAPTPSSPSSHELISGLIHWWC
jgi:hypothetical protein